MGAVENQEGRKVPLDSLVEYIVALANEYSEERNSSQNKPKGSG